MYYSGDYIWFIGAMLLCAGFSAIASAKVSRAFDKYKSVMCSSRLSGREAAVRLLQNNGVDGITVGRVSGKLSDHYDPRKGTVNLSESTYGDRSVAAVAVAAHEIGHVMQKKNGYLFYSIRTSLVPVVNIGSNLAMPLVLVGILIDGMSTSFSPELGFRLAMLGVILYASSFVFTLVTLPVELNASKRAKQMLIEEGVLSQDELGAASEVLSAAALTYLAALLTSFVYFLRFLLRVLAIFGQRNNRR